VASIGLVGTRSYSVMIWLDATIFKILNHGRGYGSKSYSSAGMHLTGLDRI